MLNFWVGGKRADFRLGLILAIFYRSPLPYLFAYRKIVLGKGGGGVGVTLPDFSHALQKHVACETKLFFYIVFISVQIYRLRIHIPEFGLELAVANVDVFSYRLES